MTRQIIFGNTLKGYVIVVTLNQKVVLLCALIKVSIISEYQLQSYRACCSAL